MPETARHHMVRHGDTVRFLRAEYAAAVKHNAFNAGLFPRFNGIFHTHTGNLWEVIFYRQGGFQRALQSAPLERDKSDGVTVRIHFIDVVFRHAPGRQALADRIRI